MLSTALIVRHKIRFEFYDSNIPVFILLTEATLISVLGHLLTSSHFMFIQNDNMKHKITDQAHIMLIRRMDCMQFLTVDNYCSVIPRYHKALYKTLFWGPQ